MNKFLSDCISFSVVIVLCTAAPAWAQVNGGATDKTKTLYANLKIIQNSNQFLFGQEFFNSFRYNSGSAHGDETYSDSKAVTGAHPAVLGSDFHYYLDKPATERVYHIEAVQYAYQQGYVITFDWHISGRGTTTYEYREETKHLVNNIVNDVNGDREWFLGELDKVISIINDDLVIDNERIPIVFRPWHEMNGHWFWWGTKSTDADTFKALFQLTVDYMKARTSSVLFCWSPNMPTDFRYYPGDDYVDILGLDYYEIEGEALRTQMAPIIAHAQAKDKVAVLSETGFRDNTGESPGDNAVKYWQDVVLPAVINDPSGNAKKIAWMLTWINAQWAGHPYVAHPASSASVKQSFIDFKNSTSVLFGDEIPDLYAPMDIPVSTTSQDVPGSEALQVFPVPAQNRLTIRLKGFAKPAAISIYDMQGKLIYRLQMEVEEKIFDLDEVLQPGTYLVCASDQHKTVTEKVVVHFTK